MQGSGRKMLIAVRLTKGLDPVTGRPPKIGRV